MKELQKFIPSVTSSDIRRGPAGVRAQAVSPDGKTVDDFCLVDGERSLHVLNAPSPGATASISIGESIAGRITERM